MNFKMDSIHRIPPAVYTGPWLARPMFEVLDFAAELLFNLASMCLITSNFYLIDSWKYDTIDDASTLITWLLTCKTLLFSVKDTSTKTHHSATHLAALWFNLLTTFSNPIFLSSCRREWLNCHHVPKQKKTYLPSLRPPWSFISLNTMLRCVLFSNTKVISYR